MQDKLVWVDLETFGLDPEIHPIIEVGFKITNLELVTLYSHQIYVWENGIYDAAYKNCSQFVLDMHNKSNLFDTVRAWGTNPRAAEDEIVEFLQEAGVSKEDPLCGSSVQFDRGMLKAQMPKVEELFSYRNIDVSSVKELCRRYNPEVYAKLETEVPKEGLHRSLSDINDTIEELRFYKDNFLWV